MNRRITPSDKKPKIERFEENKGAVSVYSVDLTLIEQQLGVTASAPSWSTQDGSVVSIGTTAFASSIASASITASAQGDALVKLSIPTSADDNPVFYFEIKVLDPENNNKRPWR